MRRRDFIRIGGAGLAGATALGGATGSWYGLYGSPLPDPGTDGTVVPSFCELCFWKCGIRAHVKDGRVTKIQGNPKDPLSRGMLCPRGAGGTGLLYDPDRLKRPLMRKGARGSQAFEEVSWDTALDAVASNFRRIVDQHGPHALGLFSHGFGGSWFTHLFGALGSPNIAAPSYAQCRGPRDVGFQLTFGSPVGSPEVTDIANTRCLVLIGSHLGENMHNSQVQEFAAAIRNGADIIVVDPRFSVAASKARYWLPIKPGTDTALLLAWMNVLIGAEKYDRAYIEQYAYGFDQLRAHVAPFTPEWAYPRTGIEPHLIRETAALLAGARPAALVHPGRHVTWYGNDTQRTRAIAILNALLGSWGRRGGFFIPSQAEVPGYTCSLPHAEEVATADRPDPSVYPLADEVLAQGLCNATIPTGLGTPSVRGWMVYGSNLLSTLPNQQETQAAIQALDFLVTIDVLPMEIVGWSDVVLPEATYLERWDDLNHPPWRTPFVSVRQPVVPPLYDSKPGWWIAKELGIRLGLADHFPWPDGETYVRGRAESAGVDFEQLKREGTVPLPVRPQYFEEGAVPEFGTASGKIELYSQTLAQHGFEPLPTYHDGELEEPPAGYFRLLTGRAPSHTFGRTTNNRLLSQVHAENEVWVNAAVAGQWGLAQGERVYLQNQDGVRSSFACPVKVTERIRPDAVFLVHGYGHWAKQLAFAHGRGIDDTELITRYRTDPIMGGTGMNVNFVTFLRAADVEAAPATGGAHAALAAAEVRV